MLSTTSNQSHHLPKLALPTFSGNILEWQTFWDSYESAVHENPMLTNVQKFNYLKAQLRDEALESITGFALTNANYEEAVNVLTERFGQTDKIINSYMQALLEIPQPRNQLTSLRKFYDKMEGYVRGLEALGQSQETYGKLLVPIILNKLPGDVRRNLAREHKSNTWMLRELRQSIREEINIIDAGQEVDTPQSIPTTSFFHVGTKQSKPPRKIITQKNAQYNIKKRPCVFCKEIHAPSSCTKLRDPLTRMNIVKRDKLCFNCLGHHRVSECKSKHTCKTCNKKHHTSLCNGRQNVPKQTDKNDQTESSETAVFKLDEMSYLEKRVNDLEKLLSEKCDIEDQFKDKNREISELEKEIEEFESIKLELEDTRESLEKEKVIRNKLEVTISDLKQILDDHRTDQENIQRQFTDTDIGSRIMEKVKSLECQVRGLQDDLFAAQEELQVTMGKHEQELEEARAAHIEIQEQIESEKNKQVLQSSPEVNGATQRIEFQKVENLEKQIEIMKTCLSENQDQLNKITQEKFTLEKEIKILRESLKQKEGDVKELETQRRELSQTLKEFHRTTGKKEQTIQKGDIAQIHYERPRTNWKLGFVKELVREISADDTTASTSSAGGGSTRCDTELRMRRKASLKARDNIRRWIE
jgi:hypothetical protein